jgi:hypothetical protein
MTWQTTWQIAWVVKQIKLHLPCPGTSCGQTLHGCQMPPLQHPVRSAWTEPPAMFSSAVKLLLVSATLVCPLSHQHIIGLPALYTRGVIIRLGWALRAKPVGTCYAPSICNTWHSILHLPKCITLSLSPLYRSTSFAALAASLEEAEAGSVLFSPLYPCTCWDDHTLNHELSAPLVHYDDYEACAVSSQLTTDTKAMQGPVPCRGHAGAMQGAMQGPVQISHADKPCRYKSHAGASAVKLRDTLVWNGMQELYHPYLALGVAHTAAPCTSCRSTACSARGVAQACTPCACCGDAASHRTSPKRTKGHGLSCGGGNQTYACGFGGGSKLGLTAIHGVSTNSRA